MISPTALKTAVTLAARLLNERKKTIAVAESCTGGLMSSLLTSVPGSSAYFIGGIVAYHPSVKERQLQVSPLILREKGAVSHETAGKMAEEVRKRCQTDFGIGITGIAGPGGGTDAKPVGLVYIAIASEENLTGKHFQFEGGRDQIRTRACLEATRLLIETLNRGDVRR